MDDSGEAEPTTEGQLRVDSFARHFEPRIGARLAEEILFARDFASDHELIDPAACDLWKLDLVRSITVYLEPQLGHMYVAVILDEEPLREYSCMVEDWTIGDIDVEVIPH